MLTELVVRLLSSTMMAVSVLVTSPEIVSSIASSHNALSLYKLNNIMAGSLLVSCGYDMQVNVWNMNNYQLKNSYKVSISIPIYTCYTVKPLSKGHHGTSSFCP